MSSFGPPLTHTDLANLMIGRGLFCVTPEEKAILVKRIQDIGYYRLEEYTWPYRKIDPLNKSCRLSEFKRKRPFNVIWETYLFDRRLRSLLNDATERFEIALRSHIAQVLVNAAGHNTPHADKSLLPRFAAIINGKTKHDIWLNKLQVTYLKSTDARIAHCRNKHLVTDIRHLPIWILLELSTFGALKELYEAMNSSLKCTLASEFGVSQDFLTSSIILLHQVRNKCAHHSRVWNISWLRIRSKSTAPFFAHSPVAPEWYSAYNQSTENWVIPSCAQGKMSFDAQSTAFVFLVCQFWLSKIAHTSGWKSRVEQVIEPLGGILRRAKDAGFCEGWSTHPIWKID